VDFLPAFGGFSALQQYLKGRIVSFNLVRAAKFSCDGIVYLPQDMVQRLYSKRNLRCMGPYAGADYIANDFEVQ
jgi:hypothetical protein